jgi:hypothetical protein
MPTTGIPSFDPFWFMRLPLSGDVNQRITVNYAGNPLVENRVVTEVASFGRQIGWLSEIAIALANKRPLPADSLRKLEAAVAEIEAIKKRVQRPALAAADDALDRLKREYPDAYKRLLRDRIDDE